MTCEHLDLNVFDKDSLNYTGERRLVLIESSPEGIRVRLGDSENAADLYVEAGPEGFRINLHSSPDVEPEVYIEVGESGISVRIDDPDETVRVERV